MLASSSLGGAGRVWRSGSPFAIGGAARAAREGVALLGYLYRHQYLRHGRSAGYRLCSCRLPSQSAGISAATYCLSCRSATWVSLAKTLYFTTFWRTRAAVSALPSCRALFVLWLLPCQFIFWRAASLMVPAAAAAVPFRLVGRCAGLPVSRDLLC